MTKRWTRSPRGKIFGVCTGLAEWRDLDPGFVRLISLIAVLFSGVFPGVIIYLILALILPPQSEGDFGSKERRHSSKYDHIYKDATDAEYKEEADKSTDDLKTEYEELKKKVEEMENEMFDKEKDWDERFNSEK